MGVTDTTPAKANTRLEDLSEYQLEQLLAQKRLNREAELPPESEITNVGASQEQAKAVGPVLRMELDIEGFSVHATVDRGAQSTITSHSTLHGVVCTA